MRPFLGIGTAAFVVLILFSGTFEVIGQETVSADAFQRSRDLTSDLAKTSVFVFKDQKKPAYKLKRTVTRKKTSAKTASKPSSAAPAETWGDLGVTVWRLTQTASGDNNPDNTLTVRDRGGAITAYGSERVEAAARFTLGDKVRLSFETPRTGYLYVVDREVFKDGTLGEPYLIFPTRASLGGDNKVQAGRVIDIPGQDDASPFFTLRSQDPRWKGEMLSVIVTTEPIPDVVIPSKPSPISAKLVAAWEDKYLSDTKEFELEGTAGKTYTLAEKEAGAAGKRQLTQSDPYPQTMYRVKMRPKEPMMINLNLLVK